MIQLNLHQRECCQQLLTESLKKDKTNKIERCEMRRHLPWKIFVTWISVTYTVMHSLHWAKMHSLALYCVVTRTVSSIHCCVKRKKNLTKWRNKWNDIFWWLLKLEAFQAILVISKFSRGACPRTPVEKLAPSAPVGSRFVYKKPLAFLSF